MSDNESKKYILSISLNALNHLGLNLYSNNAAVLSEVVANAWDADATEVHINYSEENGGIITITDDGFGMDYDDVCKKYLRVGREKRKKGDAFTPEGRNVMGRKGIGKLSMFSIAEKISVYTKKEESDGQAFMLDAAKIRQYIDSEDHSQSHNYSIPREQFNNRINRGTLIEIQQFKRGLNKNTFDGLRKRIARRFSIINEDQKFNVFLDGKEITYADRDYFHKARFLFQYHDDFSQYCEKLDKGDNGEKLFFPRECRFNEDGKIDKQGKYAIRGWIAIARHSDELDGGSKEDEDNLNSITLVVRGKVAQEDLLHEHRLGGIITKYMYGEIEADFLDINEEEDIATSSRQKIIENDPRYQALKSFIKGELVHIWVETNTLKEKKGMEEAMELAPALKDWYENLGHESLKEKARKIFGVIDKANVGKELKKELYAYGVLAFEREKLTDSTKLLDNLDESNVQQMLSFFNYVDDMEAALYREIVNDRLSVIKKLQSKTMKDVIESDLRNYLFEHLWLFDPAWERATENAEMEKTMRSVIKGKVREQLDISYIRYSMAQREHVIIELKRYSRSVTKDDIEKQLKGYIYAVQAHQAKIKDELPIAGICIVGKLPKEWDVSKIKEMEEKSLKEMGIRVMTYEGMINSAQHAYSKYTGAQEKVSEIAKLMEKIRAT